MAFEEGKKAIESIIGKKVTNVSLSRLYRVKPLSSLHLLKKKSDKIDFIDSTLLFQRIAYIFQGKEKETRYALSFELSPYPLSIFDELGFMRKSAKSELYKLFNQSSLLPNDLQNCYYVVDGGWLLHYLVWPHSKTFEQIF